MPVSYTWQGPEATEGVLPQEAQPLRELLEFSMKTFPKCEVTFCVDSTNPEACVPVSPVLTCRPGSGCVAVRKGYWTARQKI